MVYALNILVVDNYDSFTYNLVHAFRDLVGELGRVTVIENDDAAFLDRADLTVFDLIVLSPGPGHPLTDCGVVTGRILDYYFAASGPLPVLFGVCMGFEAIAVRCGVSIVKALPRHGQQWPIVRKDDILFANLPPSFFQVRYHSLVLDPDSMDRCTDLIVTSTTVDEIYADNETNQENYTPNSSPETAPWLSALRAGPQLATPSHKATIPMSFRHSSKPIWGVQFHPESILSQPEGHAILSNLCAIAASQKGHTVSHAIEVYTVASPQRIFEAIFFTPDSTSVWLDAPPGGTGRWAFMAAEGGPHWAVQLLETSVEETMNRLEEEISKKFISTEKISPIAVPCLFPVLGYESPSLVIRADRVLAIDTETNRHFCLYLEGDEEWPKTMQKKLAQIDPEILKSEQINLWPLQCTLVDSKDSYIEKIKAAQSAIALGEAYELCLTTQISAAITNIQGNEAYHTYTHLRALNPAPNAAFFHVPGIVSLLSASPERFLHIDAQGVCQVKPIKGTRPRGATAAEDQRLKFELEHNAKDIAENLMIVDLVRNDLAKSFGVNVRCPKLMHVESYPPYHQLVSTVEADNTQQAMVPTVFGLFPAGSMTGAPKVRAMAILAALEARPRGFYSGAFGYISPLTGRADLAVTIRSITYARDEISMGCGGAILALSDPEEEWREMLLKARTSLQVLANARRQPVQLAGVHAGRTMCVRPQSSSVPMTTMRYERGRGIWLGLRHLKRLKMASWDQLSRIVSATLAPGGCDGEFPPLSSGPFHSSIVETEWEPFEHPNSQVTAARITLFLEENGEFTCKISALDYAPVTSVHVPRVCVDSKDPRLRVKTKNAWEGIVQDNPQNHLFTNEFGHLTETGIANIAVLQHGNHWSTPPLSSGLLNGTLRQLLLQKQLLREQELPCEQIMHQSSHVMCFNSVRGIYFSEINTA